MALTNFEIPDDLKLAFKIEVAKNQESMTEVLLEFVKEYVGWDKRRKTA